MPFPMEAVKRNSEEFKDIKEIFDDYAARPPKSMIRLYSLKPYQRLDDRILLNKPGRDAAVIYQLCYDSVMQYFRDRSKKLFRESDKPLYYFKGSAKSKWIELPFEIAGALKKKVFPLKKVRSRSGTLG